jgi:hypothetical protein
MGRKRRKLPVDYIIYLKDRGLSLSEIKARLYYELQISISKSTLSRRIQEMKKND